MKSAVCAISTWLVVWIFVCAAGCSRDPKVRRDKFLQSGEKYFDKGDYQAASIQLRRALQIDPEFVEGHYRLAVTYERQRAWQQSYRELQKCVELDPGYVPAELELAGFDLAGRRNEAARQKIEIVLSHEPDKLEAHLLLGRIAISDKNYEEALKQFQMSQEIAPKNPSTYAEAGAVYLDLRRNSEAARAFQRAIEADATYVPAYLELAHIYRSEGNQDAEIAVLQDAIRRTPKQIAPYIAEAAAYVRQGKSGEVPTLFSQLQASTANASAALFAIGEFYFETGDVLHARSALHEALAKDAKNNSVRARLIELELNQHNWDEAERLNGELLKTQPKDPTGRLFQARLQFVQGAKATAISGLEGLVHDDPEMALPRFYLGLAYANQGEAARAVAALNDSLQRDPNFIWSYIGLAELYAQQGSPKLALEFANQALSHNPNFVPAILLQASAYMQLGDYASARAKLEPIRAIQAPNPAVLERLAVLEITQKRLARGEQDLEQALTVQPDYFPAMKDLVQLYGLQKRSVDQIIDRIEQQINRSSKQSGFYDMLGQAYTAKHDAINAQHSFEEAVKLNDGDTEARVELARLYASEGKLADALQNSQKVLDLHPDFLPGYLLLGSLYEKTGDIPKAEHAYEQAIQRNGDFAPALNNLAWLYCEYGGNLDMALGLAQHAQAKLPSEASVSDTLAWIQYRKGLYSSAARILEGITRQSPENATFRYHLGMTLWKADRLGEARQALQRALQLDLKPQEANEAKRVLALLSQRAAVN